MLIDRDLTERECCDLFLLCTGKLQPLSTYMNEQQYKNCLNEIYESKDTLSIPVVLRLPLPIKVGDQIMLKGDGDTVFAEVLLTVTEVFPYSGREELDALQARAPHPYGSDWKIQEQEGWCVTGSLQVMHLGLQPLFEDLYYDAVDIEQMKNDNPSITAFQTRNVLHSGHEKVIEYALSETKGRVVIQATVGPTQDGDTPVRYRLQSYKDVQRRMQPNVVFSVIPLAMRMLGPREALFHAIIRKNYGFTHFLVGRDHAGPSVKQTDQRPWFSPTAAQEYCMKHASLFDPMKILLPPSIESVSGSKMRALTSPSSINSMNPETWHILQTSQRFTNHTFMIQLTGLPSSGKSTLARGLQKYLSTAQMNHPCVILDGDTMRQNLFKELGFDRTSRREQTIRLGYLALQFIQTGSIVICANIAPYADDRQVNKDRLGSDRYFEVYLATPLDVCKQRDSKQLYQKALKGEIQSFTGISDPYETPENPDMILFPNLESPQTSVRQVVKALSIRYPWLWSLTALSP